ncbi:hypothetical protein QQS21_005788 [Conoideocrella luteorostrata]|uniref:Uncharacterized protein n=1 Tax=Conoideocrella luteorostrata TaxID=1105319 RepID=A0AAJ0CR92_9HYPO|nr:hypothetical protein QQS21_005788 [Conoideocrella luteorostrata]
MRRNGPVYELSSSSPSTLGSTQKDSSSSNGLRLLNHYGVTEIGAFAPIVRPGPNYNTAYLRLKSDLNLQLKAVPDSPYFRLIGWLSGSKEPFEVQDDLENNPDARNDDLEMRILGCVDDLIVLKTGYKVMPQHLEILLKADASVKEAVCVGHGFFEVAVLIEFQESSMSVTDEESFLDHVWAIISSINPTLDRHAQVSSRSTIIIKLASKVIPRTDKESVARRQVPEFFAEEIEAAYASIEHQSPTMNLRQDHLQEDIRSKLSHISTSGLRAIYDDQFGGSFCRYGKMAKTGKHLIMEVCTSGRDCALVE